MKLYTNRKYTTIAVYAAIVVAVNVLLVVAITKFGTLMNMLSSLLTILSPVIWGFVIAFLMNPIMVKTEQLFRKGTKKIKPIRGKLLRALSVTVSSVIFLGVVIGIIAVIMPELINSVMEMFNNASEIATNIQSWINRLFKNYPDMKQMATDKLKTFTTDFDMIISRIQPMLENILSGAWGLVTVLKNFVLGFIVSIYMLCSKDTLLAQLKKTLIAGTKKTTCSKIMNACSKANKVFSGFITGKLIDSLIIGMLCFIALTLMNMPYNIIISVLIGVTNIIPFFGPIIGAVPATFLMLLVDPKKAILLLIFIIILQQFDGNILGPKILGDSTGLPGFWVLISLLVFGGMFGFVGMIIAVPVTALIYSFTRDAVESKLKKKKLPVATDYYVENVEHLYQKPKRRVPMTAEELEKMEIPSADEVNEVEKEDDI